MEHVISAESFQAIKAHVQANQEQTKQKASSEAGETA